MTNSSSDKIFDSFLEEMLTNQHPPDLTEQIRQRAREEFGHSVSFKIGKTVKSPIVVPKDSIPSEPAVHEKKVHWAAIISAFAIAASLLLTIGLRQFWPTAKATLGSLQSSLHNSIETVLPDGKPTPQDSSLAEGNPAKSLSPSETQVANNKSAKSADNAWSPSTAVALEIEKLPFNNSSTNNQKAIDDSSVALKTPSVHSPVQKADPLSDEEIVAAIDQRFSDLWKVTNAAGPGDQSISDELLVERLSLRLTGKDRNQAIINPKELASRLVRSALFAEHLADQSISFWLKGTSVLDPKSPRIAGLRNSLAQQIVARKPWSQVVADLIGSQPTAPQSTFLVSMAGDSHQLVSRVGANLLDEAVGCAKCHDSNESSLAIASRQDQYWSLVGVFSGIEVKGPDKLLIDDQTKLFAEGKSKEIYFNRPDGLVQTAEYKLPGGDHWRSIEDASTPRQAMARWIAKSTITDKAAVNLAWRFVYGRPLVAQHSALDGIGMDERRELLEMLAQQFAVHNRDMAQMVSWLVNAKPFAAPELNVDKQKWLLASEKEIAKWNLATVNFANYSAPSAGLPTSSNKPTSLDSALASVVRWSGSTNLKRTTLAQPTTAPKDAKPVVPAPSDDAPAIHLVRSVQPNPNQTQFIKRIVESKLKWPEKVEHIAGLVGDSGKSSKLQSTATQLLQANNGDEAATLFQLLQGALLYSE